MGRSIGIKYYPAWLSIFPNTTTREFAHGSNMHASGINLDLQFDEIDTIISDGTEIILQSINPFVKISPSKISISDVIAAGKKSRNINGKTINYYILKKIINIKCSGGAINQHEEIKVFAKLKDKINGIEEKKEVGKLMVYKNNIIPKAEIVVVNVITNTSQKASLRTDYQYLFKNQSFNQALIRAEVKVDTEFDINSLPKNDHDVINFKSNYINSASNIGTRKASNFRDELIALYDKYGKHKPSTGKIDSNANKKTYLFFSTIIAQDRTPVSTRTTQGICSLDQNNTWGNSYVIFGTALQHKSTILHEGAHSFSLTHVFQEGGSCPHIFYMGFTDNIMDYVNQTGVSIRNPYESNDKMNCFFKWQWDLMRNDRSLILNY